MKEFIKNRLWENISILLEGETNKSGLVFVMHWLGGFKEQKQIKKIVTSFLDNDFIVISFDTTNTFWESDGNYENATVTNYYNDLEDVITWSEIKNIYNGKIVLAGSSLGWICTCLYAQKYPEKIKAITPISTVVSGQLSIDIMEQEELYNWEKTGYKIKESVSKPWVIKKLKWSHIQDRLKYNLLIDVNKLQFPILLIVGDQDNTTPLKHQKILFDSLPSKKELHVISGWPHTFHDINHLNELYHILDKWIKKEVK